MELATISPGGLSRPSKVSTVSRLRVFVKSEIQQTKHVRKLAAVEGAFPIRRVLLTRKLDGFSCISVGCDHRIDRPGVLHFTSAVCSNGAFIFALLGEFVELAIKIEEKGRIFKPSCEARAL